MGLASAFALQRHQISREFGGEAARLTEAPRERLQSVGRTLAGPRGETIGIGRSRLKFALSEA